MNTTKYESLTLEGLQRRLCAAYGGRPIPVGRTRGDTTLRVLNWSADQVWEMAEQRGDNLVELFRSETGDRGGEFAADSVARLIRQHVLSGSDPVLLADDARPEEPQGYQLASNDFDSFLQWHLSARGRPMFLSPDLFALNLKSLRCLIGHHSGLILLAEPGSQANRR